MKIYVASSWKNNLQPKVVLELRNLGHEVYVFKNLTEGDNGFHWSEIISKDDLANPEKYRDISLSSYCSRCIQ